MPLASVAAMQGRIAMYHALGEGGADPVAHGGLGHLHPTRDRGGRCSADLHRQRRGAGLTLILPLTTNARAKMSLLRRGFVKIFCRPATGVVIGGVVVAPIASGIDSSDRAGGAEPHFGDRPRPDVVGVPVIVGIGDRSGPSPDGARRSD